MLNEFYRPNLLRDRNLVANINLVWVTDFTFVKTKLTDKSNEKIKLLLVYDLANGEIVGAKVFKFNRTKNNTKNKHGISSVYVVKFFKTLFIKYAIKDLTTPLILHSDRGVEFASREYTNLEKEFPIQISMTDGYEPTQNAVAERLNRTFKNQLKYIKPKLPDSVETIQKLQTIVNKRVFRFNKDFKNKRNSFVGAEIMRKALVDTELETPQPAITHATSVLISSDITNIEAFKKKAAKTYIFNNTEDNFTNQKIIATLEQLSDQQKKLGFQQQLGVLYQQENFESVKQDLNKIYELVKKEKRNTQKQFKPKRLPITKQLYFHIMEQHKIKKQHFISFFRFRAITCLLYYTGVRLQEAGQINEDQLIELLKTKQTQIKTSKTHNFRLIVITEHAKNDLQNLWTEIVQVLEYSFQKHNNKILCHTQNNKNPNNDFVTWYNKQLKQYITRVAVNTNNSLLLNNITELSSHSFRINKITTLLWKHVPVPEVASIIGHKNINTTYNYYRWNAYSPELQHKLEQIEDDL